MWMDLKREARDEKQETSNVNMNVSQIVAHLIQTPAARQEIWAYAVNRGLGEGMQVERWLLIEMAARLMELKSKGVLESADNDHHFPIAQVSPVEHCHLCKEQDLIEN